MKISYNSAAMHANNSLNASDKRLQESLKRLSSGLKVTSAKDNPSGYAIGRRMNAQIQGVSIATQNSNRGISIIETADGALTEVHDMLQRMNELAVKAANGTNQSEDQSYIQKEVTNLCEEINRVSATTTFNEKMLLDGTFSSIALQVGAEAASANQISVTIASLSASGLGVASVSVDSQASAKTAITTIKSAIKTLNEQRANLGAIQNRLEHTVNNLDNVVENTTAAESRIRDTDMATEMVKYSNNNILAQAGQAMLAQSNQANQGVLSLLQ